MYWIKSYYSCVTKKKKITGCKDKNINPQVQKHHRCFVYLVLYTIWKFQGKSLPNPSTLKYS